MGQKFPILTIFREVNNGQQLINNFFFILVQNPKNDPKRLFFFETLRKGKRKGLKSTYISEYKVIKAHLVAGRQFYAL